MAMGNGLGHTHRTAVMNHTKRLFWEGNNVNTSCLQTSSQIDVITPVTLQQLVEAPHGLE